MIKKLLPLVLLALGPCSSPKPLPDVSPTHISVSSIDFSAYNALSSKDYTSSSKLVGDVTQSLKHYKGQTGSKQHAMLYLNLVAQKNIVLDTIKTGSGYVLKYPDTSLGSDTSYLQLQNNIFFNKEAFESFKYKLNK